jgi:hypothetical protein
MIGRNVCSSTLCVEVHEHDKCTSNCRIHAEKKVSANYVIK